MKLKPPLPRFVAKQLAFARVKRRRAMERWGEEPMPPRPRPRLVVDNTRGS